MNAPLRFTFPKYDRQIIVDLGSGNTSKGLTEKAGAKGLESLVLDLENPKPLSKLTHRSRIYIIGHCNSGIQKISTKDKTRSLSVDDIVEMLKNHAPQLKDTSGIDGIKISVIACHSATRSSKSVSFSLQLSQKLDAQKIKAEVIGRTGKVKRSQDSKGRFRKLVEKEHHGKGSKLSFITLPEGTLVSDAYTNRIQETFPNFNTILGLWFSTVEDFPE